MDRKCNIKKKHKEYSKAENVVRTFFIEIYIFLFVPSISKGQETNFIQFNYLFIELKVNGPGETNLFYINEDNQNCRGLIPPDEIQINNGTLIQNPDKIQYLNNEENIVKLIWIGKRINTLHCFFYRCNKITYVDLSNFNSSFVNATSDLFNSCKSLISVNFDKFVTSNVLDMHWMFYNCELLISVDLSNFITNKVNSMDKMFFNCSSLTSLNLSNFDTSNLSWMGNMFNGCVNLAYLNLQNFREVKESITINNVFNNTPDNILICLNRESAPKLAELITTKNYENCTTIYCEDDWLKHQKKLIKITNICIENCNFNNNYEFEFNSNCYNSCDYGFFIDKENPEIKRCKYNLGMCLLCSNVKPTKNLCISYNDSYYPKENDPHNIYPYINCYKEPEGYYLDINKYKKCYHSCKLCIYGGNNITHNCKQCKDNFSFNLTYQKSLNAIKIVHIIIILMKMKIIIVLIVPYVLMNIIN